MSSTGFTEFLHSIVIVFLWSAAVVLSINFGVESAFSYNLSERSRWHILLLVFALLASCFVQLPGTPLTPASTAGSAEGKDVVVKQPLVPSTPICNHEDREIEILALRNANAQLEAVVARERKRTDNAESKTKVAERKRDDMSYELKTTREKWTRDYLTHVDRLRQLQTANNELVDAEERIREQADTVKRSEALVTEWRRKCWGYEETARKRSQEVFKYKAELLDMSRKIKKLQREANEREATSAKVGAKQRTELARLVAKEKKRADQVIDLSPVKAIIDMAPTHPETKTLVAAIATIDISPISAATTEPSKEEQKVGEVFQFGRITATMDAPPTRPQTMTLIGPTTTISISPTTAPATKSSKQEKAAEIVCEMGPVTAILDITPTPTPTPTPTHLETKTLVGAVTTTSVLPPTSVATEPTLGSTGSAPNPPTFPGRKIKRPVSQRNRAGAAGVAATIPAPVAVSRTPREELALLIQMVEMARAAQNKVQTKAALYDIIEQMSKVAGICDIDDAEFLEVALDTLRAISSGEAQGSIIPEFLREMAGSVCDQVETIIKRRIVQAEGVGEEEEGVQWEDVDMGESDGDGEEAAEGGNVDDDNEDDEDGENVEMTYPEEYEGLSRLDLDLLGE